MIATLVFSALVLHMQKGIEGVRNGPSLSQKIQIHLLVYFFYSYSKLIDQKSWHLIFYNLQNMLQSRAAVFAKNLLLNGSDISLDATDVRGSNA